MIQKVEVCSIKGVAHIVYFKYQKTKQDSTMANQNPAGTDAAIREHQKQDFGKSQDLVPSSP